MKKAMATAATVGAAATLWWGLGGGKKPKPGPISADSLAALASIDSFPTIVARDTLGQRGATLKAGDATPLCALARNRYTGETKIVVPLTATLEDEARLSVVCERARQAVAAERGA
jgi:hypothetical protein